jgi:hypothetical protein
VTPPTTRFQEQSERIMTAAALKTACLVLPLLLMPSLAEANGKDMVSPAAGTMRQEKEQSSDLGLRTLEADT